MSRIFKFTPKPVDHNISAHHSNACDHPILPAHHSNACDHPKLHNLSSHTDRHKGVDIASAAALTPGTDGDYYVITGTTTITSITTRDPGDRVLFRMASAGLTIEHLTGTLNMRNKVDYTSEVNDILEFVSEGSGQWTEIRRTLASSEGGDQGIEFTLTMETGCAFFTQSQTSIFSSGSGFTATPTLTMETGSAFFTGVASTCNFACQCNC